MLVEYKADIIIISSNLAMISMGKTIARWLKQQTITYVTTKIDERNLFSCDEGCSDGRRVVTSDVLMEEHSMGYLFFAAKVFNATFSNISAVCIDDHKIRNYIVMVDNNTKHETLILQT